MRGEDPMPDVRKTWAWCQNIFYSSAPRSLLWWNNVYCSLTSWQGVLLKALKEFRDFGLCGCSGFPRVSRSMPSKACQTHRCTTSQRRLTEQLKWDPSCIEVYPNLYRMRSIKAHTTARTATTRWWLKCTRFSVVHCWIALPNPESPKRFSGIDFVLT